ncbi:uncharacterized protein LOC116841261 [Odontomachus brunneus]|uniref:uncharacterized protein LOC116841261 n=1 Tax=Odontomachus brunneus TaxID=486640 RepID=UPI0013F20FCF|nr:uncharacterized protein LOC116841261 [Odontomachus brunneus]XP_032664877.1 uncharacterized protein LOC116841261 [Odontomachus brunneus]XP_032664878.1 uncharacterized protein LOC116841261 [Odontomachus brunneus]
MERALKRLLQIYPITRNWMALSNYIAPLQCIQNASQMYSSNFSGHTDLRNVTISLSRKTSYTIKVAPEPMKILDVVATNHINMSLNDAVNTLFVLFDTAKRIKNLDHIESHIGFIHLCEIINRGVRYLNINNVIKCLKILIYFQTQGNTLLIQSLLQMIRANVNEMSIRNIIFLSFLLKRMESTPLRDALLIAMSVVFEIQLPTKLETDDIFFLMDSLRFMSNHNIQNQNINDIILKSLCKHKHTWNIQAAKSIFYSLCMMPQLSPLGYEILPNVQKILISKVDELSIKDIATILKKLKVAILKKHILYNEVFVDTLINSALSSNIGYTEGINVLNLLNLLDHIHIPLLKCLAAECSENPTLLKNESQKNMISLLQGFVNADYKPVFWDTIREAIIENIEGNCRSYDNYDKSNNLLSRFTLYLLALDYYNPDLLNKVFSRTIRTDETMRHICIEEILLLYQSVKALYPMYDGPWPQQNLLEYANMNLNPALECSLKLGLERALGGSQYVHNDLKTKLGHHIDHVVVMRKGGYPIAINLDTISDRITYVEDLQTPSESQIILIFNLPNKAYAVNSQRLKSTWALKIKSAEVLTKSSAVGINSNFWMKLPEYEKIPYLMQAIKLKCEDRLVSTN